MLGRHDVDTPEQVGLQYSTAGIGTRFIAALIDSVVLVVLIVLAIILVALLSQALGAIIPAGSLSWLTNASTAIGIAVVTVIFLGYYVFFDMIWNGSSPGKRVVGLRVVRLGGYPITFVDSITRNIIRAIDFLPFWYIVGIVTMFINPQSRRLGDIVAGTVVIKEGRSVRLKDLVRDADRALEATPNDMARLDSVPRQERFLIEEFLRRRAQLSFERRRELAADIVARVRPYLDPSTAHLNDEERIEAAAKMGQPPRP